MLRTASLSMRSVSDVLEQLRTHELLDPNELETFLAMTPLELEGDANQLTEALLREGLLNEYQLARVLSGKIDRLLFGDYRVLEPLAPSVYRVEHRRLKRLAVVKVLERDEKRPEIPLPLAQGEVQMLAALKHPGLVLPTQITECDSGRSLRYLVLEHVAGRDLERVVHEEGRLPVGLACSFVCQAAEALRHAYEHGFLHRRLRPSRLLLTPQEQIRILGLGEDRLGGSSSRMDEFLAPELHDGSSEGTARADVYGLGATLYYLLTAQRATAGDRNARRSLVPVRRIRPEVPLELEAVVCQMTALDPGDRYPTPLAVLRALEPFRDPSPPFVATDARPPELTQVQDTLLFAMARLAESRGLETEAHLLRMQQYVRVLAETAARLPHFAGRLDAAFIRKLERSVVLHDVGKVAIPDHVLLKPGKLDPEERSIMEAHTVLGANFLQALAGQPGAPVDFLHIAIEIARHHHERWDGTGYPDGLSGDRIPLAARITMFADVYDALRCRLVYKPGLGHAPSRRLILDTGPGQFDPNLLTAFRQCEASFQHIFEMTQ